MEILECKHGLYKQTCSICSELDNETVIKEKQEALEMKSWQSTSFMGAGSHNSAFEEQEYDVEADDIEIEAEKKEKEKKEKEKEKS